MTVAINNNFRNQMVSEKFEWMSVNNARSKEVSRSTSDVSIRECEPNKAHTKTRYNITFRNHSAEVLGNYVDLAIYKNRIFFRPSSAEDRGYKIYKHDPNTSKSKPYNPFTQVNKTEYTEGLSEFIGNYEMKFDEFYELYYVERA